MKKKTIFLACLLFIGLSMNEFVSGQETTSNNNLSFGTDLVSRYIWRGLNVGGNSPAIQPFIEYAFGSSGLTAGVWGSYPLSPGGTITEVDLYLTWSPVAFVTASVYDYFYPSGHSFERNGYFNYKKNQTGHTFEAILTLGGTESFPFYATFAMNFYGVDGVNEKGENYNAKYIEIGYGKSFGDTQVDLFLGLAPDNPHTDQGGSGYYGEKAGIINTGLTLTRNINIADFSLPVFTSAIINPEAGNVYIVLGLSF